MSELLSQLWTPESVSYTHLAADAEKAADAA